MTRAPRPSGVSPAAKLLIVHADDLGMCHSVNRAIIAALEAGAVSSASMMVPCDCFEEAAAWASRHRSYDIGIHSTLISEWKALKWGPVSKKTHSHGLVDENGHFWSRNSLLQASPEEVQQEIAAQITLAQQRGIEPTHLDCHMLSVARPEYIGAYVKTARKFGLPFLIDEYWRDFILREDPAAGADIVVSNLYQAHFKLSPESLEDYYLSVLRELKPGLNVLLVHLGFDDAELRSITGDSQAYGAAWRQKDFEIVMSGRFTSALRENDIQLVNWRTVKSRPDAELLPTRSQGVL